MSSNDGVSRRRFLKSSALLLGTAAVPWIGGHTAGAASVATAIGGKPQLAQGIQIGDVLGDRAVIWSRADRPARLVVDYDVSSRFDDAVRVRGPFALENTDYTARVDLTDLPDDSEIYVRVMFQDLSNDRALSDAVHGHFRTAPTKTRSIRFLWSGDTAGQGWGINPEFGGMKIYEAMRQTHPDFFIHSRGQYLRRRPDARIRDGRRRKAVA